MQKLERATSVSGPHSDLYKDDDVEAWANDLYSVFVRGNQPVPEMKTTICHISFHRHDRRAILDWRHMQWMKNQLVGEENEGMELFPAESRLVDGANEFHLWVFEDEKFKFPWGFVTRIVGEKSHVGETQRKFPTMRKPEDCDARAEELKATIKKLKEELKNKEG
jgi:hypothetical protein